MACPEDAFTPAQRAAGMQLLTIVAIAHPSDSQYNLYTECGLIIVIEGFFNPPMATVSVYSLDVEIRGYEGPEADRLHEFAQYAWAQAVNDSERGVP